MEQYMPYIWIVLAVLMAGVEAFTVQLVSVWFVIGALCAAVTTIFTPSIPIQAAVFLIVSVAALVITKPIVKKLKKNKTIISTNSDRYIGQIGELLSELETPQSVGQAKVLSKIWSVRSDDAPLETGSKVKVLSIEGVKLIVEKAE